jgi:hypothetical protein
LRGGTSATGGLARVFDDGSDYSVGGLGFRPLVVLE